MPTRLLAEEGHDITVFYANGNIAPAAEYGKRLDELRRYAAQQGFEVIEGAYNPDEWERKVAPIGESIKEFSPALGAEFAAKHVGSDDSPIATVAELLDDDRRRERCRACYRMRLEETARAAAEGGFEGMATTLAVSPYQFTDVIHEELRRTAGQAGIEAHFHDYRPYYDEATRISRELGMYRQNYCGCRFSIREAEATRAFVKEQRKAAKAAKAEKRAREEEATRKRAAEKQAYAEAQAKKRAVLKSLRANPM